VVHFLSTSDIVEGKECGCWTQRGHELWVELQEVWAELWSENKEDRGYIFFGISQPITIPLTNIRWWIFLIMILIVFRLSSASYHIPSSNIVARRCAMVVAGPFFVAIIRVAIPYLNARRCHCRLPMVSTSLLVSSWFQS
jgi:hypothetical protein